MLNLQCINAPKAVNCFSVNITCNGLPMMIKVDYSKLTANEKRDKKISLSSWSLSFSCPSASLFVFTVSSYHLLVLFSFHLVGLWDFLGFGFTSLPLVPRWDVSPLQVTPQHFIRFPWQQYPYIILGGEGCCESKVSHPRTQHSNMSKSWTQSSRHLPLTPKH